MTEERSAYNGLRIHCVESGGRACGAGGGRSLQSRLQAGRGRHRRRRFQFARVGLSSRTTTPAFRRPGRYVLDNGAGVKPLSAVAGTDGQLTAAAVTQILAER